MADGYHRFSGKVGVVIAHVMGGSYQLAGQLFNAQVAGSSLLVIAGDWASELQDYRGLAPFPGLSQAESMRPITKEARCAYQVHTNPKAITRGHHPRAARGHHAADRAGVPLDQRRAAEPRGAGGARSARARSTRSSGRARRAPQTIEAIARRLGEAQCPVLMFGDDVWRGGAQAEAVRLAELLEAPVFASRQIFAELPDAPSALLRQLSRRPRTSRRSPGSSRTCSSSWAARACTAACSEPTIMQIGPNPLLMGRHYPLDWPRSASCARRCAASPRRSARVPAPRRQAGPRQRAKVRAFAKMLIEREENLVREHEHDPLGAPGGAGGAPRQSCCRRTR